LATFNDKFIDGVEKQLKDNLFKAAVYLKTKIKERLNVTGNPILASRGPGGRHYRNETVSAPGDAPHKMLGNLQRSIAHAVDSDGKTAYVGSNLDYALYLEIGTSKMAARPFFRPIFQEEADTLAKILTTGTK
jgi:HK97 gp10 family phage protein